MLLIYPNSLHHVRGLSPSSGPLRNGIVEENSNTLENGTAGLPAAVTYEKGGYARVYVLVKDGKHTCWHGPYLMLSEEVVS